MEQLPKSNAIYGGDETFSTLPKSNAIYGGDETFSTLPADILYEISIALTKENSTVKDKIENGKQILRLCKINKRFYTLYGKNDKIWKKLYERDITLKLPTTNICHRYMQTLKEIDDENINEVLIKSSKLNYEQAVYNAINSGADIHYKDDVVIENSSYNNNFELSLHLLKLGALPHRIGIYKLAEINDFIVSKKNG